MQQLLVIGVLLAILGTDPPRHTTTTTTCGECGRL
jgi:hypothetical protein